MSDTPTKRPGQVSRPDKALLYRVASRQSGYFTSDQAAACGYGAALLSYHERISGRYIRLRRGLYRLREFPTSSREAVIAAWLALGKHIAVVSHASALHLLGLVDSPPAVVHITLPRSRRNVTSTRSLAIHTVVAPLSRADLVLAEGVIATTPLRSILDATSLGLPLANLKVAIERALDRKLLTADDLRDAAGPRGRRVSRQINRVLDERSTS
jgi:predicted transcriptional regulator of viral defense system